MAATVHKFDSFLPWIVSLLVMITRVDLLSQSIASGDRQTPTDHLRNLIKISLIVQEVLYPSRKLLTLCSYYKMNTFNNLFQILNLSTCSLQGVLLFLLI